MSFFDYSKSVNSVERFGIRNDKEDIVDRYDIPQDGTYRRRGYLDDRYGRESSLLFQIVLYIGYLQLWY